MFLGLSLLDGDARSKEVLGLFGMFGLFAIESEQSFGVLLLKAVLHVITYVNQIQAY